MGHWGNRAVEQQRNGREQSNVRCFVSIPVLGSSGWNKEGVVTKPPVVPASPAEAQTVLVASFWATC